MNDLPNVKEGDDIPAVHKAVGQSRPDADTAPSTSEEVGSHNPNTTGPMKLDGAAQPYAPGVEEPAHEDDSDGPMRRAPRPGSKLDRITTILSSAQGATIDELTTETGWLPHTARAALTGLRKRGFTVQLDRAERAPGSVYRIVAPLARNTES